MTLDQLRYFYEAARLQHVGKAARLVHISPSAISTAIASLESELECKLFDRIGKSVVLTESGRKLKSEAEKLFDQVEGLKARIQNNQGQLRGDYRIAASHALAPIVLARAWSQLQNQHPELNGEVCSLPTGQILRELVLGSLDAGLCFSPSPHPELKQIQLHQGKLVLVVRAGHPLLKLQARKALNELSRYPAVIHKAQPGVGLCEAHPIFARYGITPRIRFSFDDDACAVARVTSSDSWAMVPDLVAEIHSKGVKPVSLPSDWDATYTLSLVFRNDREGSPLLKAMNHEIKKRFVKSKST